jgi:hypothetical protein
MQIYALLFYFLNLYECGPLSKIDYHIGTAQLYSANMSSFGSPYRVYSKTIHCPELGIIVNINGRDVLGRNQFTFDGISILHKLLSSTHYREIANQNNELINGIVIIDDPSSPSNYISQRFLGNDELHEIFVNGDEIINTKVRWYQHSDNTSFYIKATYYKANKDEFDYYYKSIISKRRTPETEL